MISVIIPVYNCEKYLHDCIQSVLNQQYKKYEIILVDDCSNDGSSVICDTYSEKYSNIKVIHHDKNLGLSVSREDGFRKATGDFIFFMDNDDWISPNTFRILIDKIYDNDIVCAAGLNTNDIEDCFNKVNATMYIPPIYKTNGVEGYVKSLKVDKYVYSATWGKIYKKEVVTKALNYTLKLKDELFWVYLEDIVFLPVCMCTAEKVAFIEDPLYYHRITDKNLSSKITPTEYHYQCIIAGMKTLEYLRIHSYNMAYDAYLPGYILNMQSIWYRVKEYEIDIEKKIETLKRIEDIISQYSCELTIKKSGIICCLLSRIFTLSPSFWHRIIGKMVLGRKYK